MADDENTPYDGPETDKAIDAIAEQDSDALLAEQDNVSSLPPASKRRWWRRAWFHWLLALLILGGLGAAAGVPASRYWLLNHAGVRSSVAVTLVDRITLDPLQGVTVTVADQTARSGNDGHALVRNLRMGPATLTISRPGFATVRQPITVGWGSNPVGTTQLKAIGVQYTVLLTDYYSGKPIGGAQVESADSATRSNAKGLAVITVPNNEATPQLDVTIGRDGYRTEATTVDASTTKPLPVALVTSRKEVYVSKQSGTYDLYTSDADGRNQQVILPGTGLENADIGLAVSPDGSQAALVSTRDKLFTTDGYPLSALTLVDLSTGSSTVITHADHIQLIDWIGTRLVFEQTESAAAKSHSIISYDYAATSRFQLAAAAKFNAVVSARGALYYAIAPAADDASVHPYLYRIDPDGGNQQTVLEKEVWTAYRTAYDTISLQTSDAWYTHTISTKRNVIAGAPSQFATKMFTEQPNGGHSLWVDTRGNTGVLTLHDNTRNKDSDLQAVPGLARPVRWLTDDIAIYRVVSGNDVADYAIGTTGGRQPHRIATVTNTFGFSTGQ